MFGVYGVFIVACLYVHDFFERIHNGEQNGGKLVSIATVVRQAWR